MLLNVDLGNTSWTFRLDWNNEGVNFPQREPTSLALIGEQETHLAEHIWNMQRVAVDRDELD